MTVDPPLTREQAEQAIAQVVALNRLCAALQRAGASLRLTQPMPEQADNVNTPDDSHPSPPP